MPSSPIREELAGLAWSMWAELGVSGWERRHRTWFVDPEPLLIFTAWLGDEDARLRDEVTDWCISYGTWISATRLANMLRANENAAGPFGELAATVASHSTLRWRGATRSRPYRPTLKSQLASFENPSLVGLRLRALLGVSARAEIVRQLLSYGSLARSASDLVEDAGFMKRHVAGALDDLRLGGALDSMKSQNKLTYRLSRPAAWRTLLGELPSAWPRWSSIVPVLTCAVDAIDHLRAMPARSANVEMNKTARRIASLVERAGLEPLRGQEHGVEGFEDWTLRTVRALASADPRVFVGAAESA
jgi:hypothetical protein